MLTVTYKFTCNECGEVHEWTSKWIPAGGARPLPALPYGWCELDGKHICANHEVVVKPRVE